MCGDPTTAGRHSSSPIGQVGPLAVLGFCMGGRNTYLLAGARPDIWSAAGVFYGGNIMKPWGDGPSPFDLTEQIACPDPRTVRCRRQQSLA